MKKILYILIILVPILCYTQTGTKLAQEYELKAAYLERFTRFIEWSPESDIYITSKPFLITVLGDNPFGDILNKMYSKQKIKDKKVIIKYISNIDDLGKCHLLFIATSAKSQIIKTIKTIQNKPIITVSQSPGMAEQGVMINLFNEDNTIRYEINNKSIRNAGLKVSHLLLQKARIVDTPGDVK